MAISTHDFELFAEESLLEVHLMSRPNSVIGKYHKCTDTFLILKTAVMDKDNPEKEMGVKTYIPFSAILFFNLLDNA